MIGNDLNALIGSRICHDLISPLGAIGNGVELLSMSGMAASPEMALIAESVENANARIRFFRVAFGGAVPGTEIGQSEVQSIIHDMYKGGRSRVDWRVDGPQERADVKLAFLLLQCLENAMPRGGQISVTKSPSGWKMEARAEKMKAEPELWNLLTDTNARTKVVAADVHFALVADAAKIAGRSVASFIRDTEATLSF